MRDKKDGIIMTAGGKKGDITIDAMFGAFIGLVTIILLVSFFSLQMPTFAKEIYCKTFFYVASASFMPSGIRQDSSYCREFSMLETEYVKPQKVFVKTISEGSSSKLIKLYPAGWEQLEILLPENRTIEDFSFSAMGNLSNFSAGICGPPDDWNVSQMVPSRKYSSPKDMLKSAKECASKCSSFPCPITLNISGENGIVVISDISLAYRKCLLEEEIASNILACWEKANRGQYSKGIKCKALVVSNCETTGISEQSITEYLKQQGLCRIIGNTGSDPECGESDDILWEIVNLKPDGSVLIEFVNSTKKIRVS